MYLDKLYYFLIIGMTITEIKSDPAGDQLVMYKNQTQSCPIGTWTTSTGSPMDIDDTRTLNKNPLRTNLFLDSIIPFLREKRERVLHVKGAGAVGYFEVTDDVTDICKADFLSSVGKRTKVAVRFSVTSAEKGSPDTTISVKGFAVKFYTNEGNFDLLGINSQTFFIKDPVDFASEIRSGRRNPVTNLRDPAMKWDFITLRQETLNTLLFNSVTTPDGYQHMPGYGVHTFQIENKQGDLYFVRFRMIPDQGVKNLTLKETSKISSDDPDYYTRKLYNAIANSDFPSWTLSVQVFTMSDITNNGSDLIDITKRVSLKRFPPRRVGRLVLNKNPNNYFSQIEQLAFNPFNLVPGIDGGVDNTLPVRALAYNIAQNIRLGSNFNKIPVNCPLRKALTYIRDGSPPVGDNMKGAPNYFPNSFNGPEPLKEKIKREIFQFHEDPPNNIEQTRDFYLHEISVDERKMVIEGLVKSLQSAPEFIKHRALNVFEAIDPGLRSGVEKGLQEASNKN